MGRYSNVSAKLNSELKRRYYDSVLDPIIPRQDDDIYVVCTFGDRLDLLAWRYYSNVELWWIIAAANPELRKDSVVIEPGTQLRIPLNYQNIIASVQSQNNAR